MTQSSIKTPFEKTQFTPGEVLEGSVSWQSDAPVKKAELRLFCFTSGRGTRDVDVVGKELWEHCSPSEQQRFAFTLPEGPYSFSGELISLQWALELVISPGKHTDRFEFTLSPDGKEVDLYRYPVDSENLPKGIAQKLKRKRNARFRG